MANTPIPNIHLCWVCCKVFPSQLSLLLHCALVNHENTTDIYCGICHLIVHDTTQFSHVQAHHDLFTECPMCPGSLIRSMDLIVHLQSATVHPHWEHAKRHLTRSQIIYLDTTRTAEIRNFVCTDTSLNELLESTSMQVHLDYLPNQTYWKFIKMNLPTMTLVSHQTRLTSLPGTCQDLPIFDYRSLFYV